MKLSKYKLSYTASSLRVNDTLLVLNNQGNEDYIDQTIGNGKSSTGKRIRKEIQDRLNNLTHEQLEFLKYSSLDDAKRIIFLSICKTYEFIYEFVIEVLRSKILNFDYTITEGDYISFYNYKAALHPELENLSESSQYKIKQVLFKILEEANIIDSVRTKSLQHQYLTEEMITLILKDNPSYAKIFFMTDKDIQINYEKLN